MTNHTTDNASKRGVVDAAHLVRERCQAIEHEGVLLDATTAGAIVAVANALSAEQRARLNDMPVVKAVTICWKLVARHSK